MMKIYTRTGDSGETSLLGGIRVRKDDLRIETIGCVDETNASIGMVRVELQRSGVAPEGVDALLATIQHALFNLGAELASRTVDTSRAALLSDAGVTTLETAIDRSEERLEPLQNFILPGGAAA